MSTLEKLNKLTNKKQTNVLSRLTDTANGITGRANPETMSCDDMSTGITRLEDCVGTLETNLDQVELLI